MLDAPRNRCHRASWLVDYAKRPGKSLTQRISLLLWPTKRSSGDTESLTRVSNMTRSEMSG